MDIMLSKMDVYTNESLEVLPASRLRPSFSGGCAEVEEKESVYFNNKKRVLLSGKKGTKLIRSLAVGLVLSVNMKGGNRWGRLVSFFLLSLKSLFFPLPGVTRAMCITLYFTYPRASCFAQLPLKKQW